MRTISAAEVAGQVGREAGVSDWIEISQAMIDIFADVTMDRQLIHVAPEYAEATSFGSTIAHGFLTLSLLSRMSYDALPQVDGTELSLNYGMNRLRFLSPVRTGKRVRGRFVLEAVERKENDRLLQTYDVTVEIDGESKPALIVQWLTLTLLRSTEEAPTP
jgi:acyl dehydratase